MIPVLAIFRAILLLVLIGLLQGTATAAAESGCLMCHKYPGLGRIERNNPDDETGVRRVFYIDQKLFSTTYHAQVPCKGCHTSVTRIPHTAVEPVKCGTDCHITDPSVSKPFSHKRIVEDFELSAHGREGSVHDDKTDLPVCKDCHNNKAYHIEVEHEAENRASLRVCEECHQSSEFTKFFYEHVTYRMLKRRDSKQVIELCSTCHADQIMMAKHDLDSVVGFSETFHSKAIAYGNQAVANCLNCHAPYQLGFSAHRITSRRDETSPVHTNNTLATCSQVGCHAKANDSFADVGRVHPSRKDRAVLVKAKTDALKSAAKDVDAQGMMENLKFDEGIKALILYAISIFYKVVIALVVGGMAIHRLLEFVAALRERKRGDTNVRTP